MRRGMSGGVYPYSRLMDSDGRRRMRPFIRAVGSAGLAFIGGLGTYLLCFVANPCFLDADFSVSRWRETLGLALFAAGAFVM